MQHLAWHLWGTLRQSISDPIPMTILSAGFLVACMQGTKDTTASSQDTSIDSEETAIDSRDSPGDSEETPPTCPDTPYVFVTVEDQSACGIHEDGCISCWNGGGPTEEVFPPSHYQQVVIGRKPLSREGEEWNNYYPGFVCALDEVDEMVCEGEFNFGELPEGPFQKISGGTSHICGLRLDGRITCGGDDWKAKRWFPTASISMWRRCICEPVR